MTEPSERALSAEAAELELRRKNMRWGWALLGVFCVLFAGTVAVAYAYLWLS